MNNPKIRIPAAGFVNSFSLLPRNTDPRPTAQANAKPAAGVYQRGLGRMAPKLDESPGNLSVQLSGDGQRKFDLDALELYIEKSGDLTPIRFLVAKYCGDASASRDEALEKIQTLFGDLPSLLAASGLNTKRTKGHK